MTIKRKNIRPGGLLEVESDPTDTVDTLGFSDPISTVGAKTAKFSGGATMQANSGLRIGLTQVKFNAAVETDPRTIIPITDLDVPARVIDNNLTTFGAQTYTQAPAKIFATVDFGSLLISEQVQARVGAESGGGLLSVPNVILQISTDNSVWVTVAGPTTITPGATLDFDGGIQTYQFARIQADGVTSGGYRIRIFEIFSTIGTATAQVKLISSATQDSSTGTDLISEFTITANTTTTFDTDLLLTGNAQFVTLVIISFSGLVFLINLSDITSIKEV